MPYEISHDETLAADATRRSVEWEELGATSEEAVRWAALVAVSAKVLSTYMLTGEVHPLNGLDEVETQVELTGIVKKLRP